MDWPLPDGELDELTRETPGVSIKSWTGACPAEYVQHLARLVIQMDEDVDLGDLSRPTTVTDLAGLRQNEQRLLAQGYLTLTSLAIVDGTPVGYTTLHVDRNWPEMVIQDDTLVDRDALTRYYLEAGTPPGVWLGTGLPGLAGGIKAGTSVGEAQLRRLMGHGQDPNGPPPSFGPVAL